MEMQNSLDGLLSENQSNRGGKRVTGADIGSLLPLSSDDEDDVQFDAEWTRSA